MSTQRGNSEKKKAPKYANKMAFRNDLHDTNRRTKAIREIEVTGCCDKCTKVIQWKIKYKKYKPLTVPKKCVKCQQKTVLNAYYIVCQPCAKRDGVCGKCADDLKKANAESAEAAVTKTADDTKVDVPVNPSPDVKTREAGAKDGDAPGSGTTPGDAPDGESSSKDESSIDENDSLDADSVKSYSDDEQCSDDD